MTYPPDPTDPDERAASLMRDAGSVQASQEALPWTMTVRGLAALVALVLLLLATLGAFVVDMAPATVRSLTHLGVGWTVGALVLIFLHLSHD